MQDLAIVRLIPYLCLWMTLALSGCAALYKVQLSDVESQGKQAKPLSVKVSETTVNLRQVSDLAKSLGKASGARAGQQVGKGLDTYMMLFQYGPKTGVPVYNEYYARDIPERLSAECKNGRLTNITSVREARNYPIISGQVIRIDATCVQP